MKGERVVMKPTLSWCVDSLIRLLLIAALILAGHPAADASPQDRTIPTPESVLGFTVGADFRLATYEDAVAYFERLAAASDRVQLVHVGYKNLEGA